MTFVFAFEKWYSSWGWGVDSAFGFSAISGLYAYMHTFCLWNTVLILRYIRTSIGFMSFAVNVMDVLPK